MIRPFPLVTAHAGCMGTEPNGPEHIRRAIESGADIVELDIRLSADGMVVLAHDEELDLPDRGSAPYRELRWKAIEAARGAGGRPLDLDAAFDLIEDGRVVVNLDAKEPEAAIAAAAIARRRGREESVLFSGLGPAEARLMRERIPRFRYLLNADSVLPAGGFGLPEIREACRLVAECSCCGINLEWSSATEELMDYARRRCVPVMLWTVDEEEDMRRALALGPYSLTTNRPDLLARIARIARG